MTQKNTDSQLPATVPNLQKPDLVPEWIPQTSDSLSVDDVIKEISVIGFDRNGTPAETRLKALEKLMKHKGAYIERSESRFIDQTQVALATGMFNQMSVEERQEWLSQHLQKVEAQTSTAIPLHPSSPPNPPPTKQAPPPPKSSASTTLSDLHGK